MAPPGLSGTNSAFVDVSVVPTYGKFQAQIIWRVRPGFEDSQFTILRSPDGLNDWKEIGIVDRGYHFVDPDLITDGKLSLLYYQVALKKDGHRSVSSVINTLGEVTHQEFGAAYWIMQQEYKKLSQCTRILIFKMRTTAPPCKACTDKDTGQQIGTALCVTCYGTGFEGGYWPPATSFMQIVSQSPTAQLDSAEGAGSTDPFKCKVRMLAYPPLIKEDLLVDPKADRRYLVETQDISYLKGKIPIISMSDVVLLRHEDVRYKIPT